MLTQVLMDELSRTHQNLLEKIESHLRPEQFEWLRKGKIKLNPRLRTSLGRACYHGNWIEINPRLVEKYPHELAPTLAHEFAHVVAPLLFGNHGHGHRLGWQRTMRLLGFPPERTHNLDVDEFKVSHSVVAWGFCGCEKPHPIKKRRYLRMRFKRRRYQCLKCGEVLKLARSSIFR